MGLQPTASKTALLLECQRPFDPETEIEEREPNEAATYGTKFHAAMLRVMTGQRWADTDLDFVRHVDAARECLQTWMNDNVFERKFKIAKIGPKRKEFDAERPRALQIYLDAFDGASYHAHMRSPAFDEETHQYDLRPGEIGGTTDLVLIDKSGFRVVVDYKTGAKEWDNYGDDQDPDDSDFSDPRTPQMLTLAEMTGAQAVAILHAPKDGIPVIYAREVETSFAFGVFHAELSKHVAALGKAMSRVGDGSMRPGPWCKRCPAKQGCPTNNAEVAKATTALVRQIGNSAIDTRCLDIGKIHQLLPQAERGLKLMRDEIKERVRSGEVIERPNGKTLQIVERTVERMAGKGDFQKAMTEEEFEKLRAKGLVKTTTEERLEAR
jgi:hypothetical protein